MQHWRISALSLAARPLARSQWAASSVLVPSVALSLGLSALLASTLGCSERDVSLLEFSSTPALEVGQLELALTARGASGALYRLRQAQFFVAAQTPDPFGGQSAFLSSENDPFSSTLETTLEIGDYQIDLFQGWFLEKVEGEQVTRVEARLLSPASQSFSILANEETAVSFRFETSGERIAFGQGRLIVELEVQEQDAGPVDPVEPVVLGEPLEFVDGFIEAESNPHGIRAAAFAASAPVGASIEVTSNSGEFCVKGSIDVVQNDDFATQWGAVLGFEFLSADGLPAPWDLDGGNVMGFAFRVSGPQLSPMRFSALPGGADPSLVHFCRDFPSEPGTSFPMPLESLDLRCWEGVRAPLLTDDLSTISWSVLSEAAIAHTFDVCISDLRPILR